MTRAFRLAGTGRRALLASCVGISICKVLRGGSLQPAQGEGVELQAWVSDLLARQLREAPLSVDMQLTALEHGHRLRATVEDGWGCAGGC